MRRIEKREQLAEKQYNMEESGNFTGHRVEKSHDEVKWKEKKKGMNQT